LVGLIGNKKWQVAFRKTTFDFNSEVLTGLANYHFKSLELHFFGRLDHYFWFCVVYQVSPRWLRGKNMFLLVKSIPIISTVRVNKIGILITLD
jgi:hypothetical protein